MARGLAARVRRAAGRGLAAGRAARPVRDARQRPGPRAADPHRRGTVPDGGAGHPRGADGPRDRPRRAAQHGRPGARGASARARAPVRPGGVGRAGRERPTTGSSPTPDAGSRPARRSTSSGSRASSPGGRRSRSSAPRRRPTATRGTSRRTAWARRSSAMTVQAIRRGVRHRRARRGADRSSSGWASPAGSAGRPAAGRSAGSARSASTGRPRGRSSSSSCSPARRP